MGVGAICPRPVAAGSSGEWQAGGGRGENGRWGGEDRGRGPGSKARGSGRRARAPSARGHPVLPHRLFSECIGDVVAPPIALCEQLTIAEAPAPNISDEFRRSIEAIHGYEDKVRIVLNKADQVDHQELMRVYGEKCLN